MPSPAGLRLFRTTAFKLTVIFLAVFTVFAAFLIGYIARNTTAILEAQMRSAVESELRSIALQYERGGMAWLARVIALRSAQPGASLYYVANRDGDRLAGNIETVSEDILDRAGPDTQLVPYMWRDEEGSQRPQTALVRVLRLPDGSRVLVGRDVSERAELVSVVRRSLILTAALMVALGVIAWLFVSRRVLKRIDAITETSRRFVDGDLSGRLEVTGAGDEFDRLAESLNTMLARIEALVIGLKQVSDNIAHDLKTPLTRMRNRVERVLAHTNREGGGDTEYRDALHATIEEADQLIRTFNALLLIARAEAGSSHTEFTTFDARAAAHDVLELYEPLAEERGVTLTLEEGLPAMVHANRELISQAVANLIDNALKYAEGGAPRPLVSLSATETAGRVIIRVADNGPGIPEGEWERVTERFVRLDKSRSKPGAGLGLSLVAAVAHLHGGTLDFADNTPGLAVSLALPGYRAG